MRKYTAPLSLTTLVCFMGTLQSIAVTLVMEHKPSAWAIGFDMNLLAAVYAVCYLSFVLHMLTDSTECSSFGLDVICISKHIINLYKLKILTPSSNGRRCFY